MSSFLTRGKGEDPRIWILLKIQFVTTLAEHFEQSFEYANRDKDC